MPERQINLPEGVPPLTQFYVYLTSGCNLACRHCWISPSYQARGGTGGHLDYDLFSLAIKEGLPLGLKGVKLTGGEPLLHPDFLRIVDLIKENKLGLTIETNGTLMTDYIAHYLREKSTLSHISVSLDGSTAESHEYLRSVDGSFSKAKDGISRLVQAGFHPQLICTLHRGNIKEISQIVILANQLGCGSVKFNHVQRTGRGEYFANENGLDIEELILINEMVKRELIQSSQIPIFFDIPFAFLSVKNLLDEQLSRCNVHNILGILANGDLSLCGIGSTIPELIFGKIVRNKLHDVWCNSLQLVQLRKLIPDQLEGTCSECIHKDLCQGQCIANNYHLSGKINAPYYFCDQATKKGLFPSSRKK